MFMLLLPLSAYTYFYMCVVNIDARVNRFSGRKKNRTAPWPVTAYEIYMCVYIN